MEMCRVRKKSGFTLAEVLIALALLGIVAAFAIPKVLQSVGNNEDKAKFRETYASLSDLAYKGMLNGELRYDTVVPFFTQQLNAVKTCTNAQTGGCYPGAHTAPNIDPTMAGMVLHNGIMIIDMENSPNPLDEYDTFWIDLNGTAKPNANCQDQIPLMVIYRNEPITGSKPGMVRIVPTTIDAQSGCPQSAIARLMN